MSQAEIEVQHGGGGGPTSVGGGKAMVELPSGANYPVLTAEEGEHLRQRVQMYAEHNAFQNVSDLADLDRVLTMELLTYRWGIWLAQQCDYTGRAVNEKDLRTQIKEWSLEIRQLKRTLGIDKMSRDKAKGEGSLPHYIAQLQYRAGVFGVMRSKQAAKATELAMQAISLVTLHDNTTPTEREELHCTAEDLVEWFRTVFTPEFEEIDRSFRQTEAKYWVRLQ